MVRTRIDALDRDVSLIIDEELSPEAQSRHVAAMARQLRDEAAATNRALTGQEPTWTTTVDGRAGATEETVKVPGRIDYDFDAGSDVVAYVVGLIAKTAPKRSGRYAKSLAVYADGVEVERVGGTLDAEEIIVVSTVAYARKIERGRKGYAPGGVFEGVAAMAMSRYGNMASIKFTFASPLGGGTHLEAWASKTKQTRKRFQGGGKAEAGRIAWNRRNPAILIRMR
ncbi:hypothetical protein [Pleomorphomonas sp. JP5]|uniref:hypothetical protein n=1 Tax=Pleomorphomonas sp. JP5 TaxID=2942998 RepID=UPI00204323A8|nr:hypothetical protein [Pleomorphomonas sp. JP5]MCM5556285.1 hypothetical protein [Pleomorphomonas sp. JP5]